MEHGEVVDQAVVVAVLTGHERFVPGHLQVLLDNFIVTAHVLEGQGGHGICALFTLRVFFRTTRAVPVEAGMLVAILLEEVDNALCHLNFANRVGSEQVEVHTEVHRGAHGVVHVLGRIRVVRIRLRLAIEGAVVGEQTGVLVGRHIKVIACGGHSPFPLVGILFGPAGEQFQVSRQVIGRVGEIVTATQRLEHDNVVALVKELVARGIPP